MCTSFHWISGVDRRTRRVVAVDVGRIDVDRFDKPVGAMNIGDSIAGPGRPRLGCHTCPGDNLGLGACAHQNGRSSAVATPIPLPGAGAAVAG